MQAAHSTLQSLSCRLTYEPVPATYGCVDACLAILQWRLGRTMLLACEVAMEYMLGLSFSPQIQILRSNPAARQLQAEVRAEIEKVRGAAATSHWWIS